MYMNQIILAFKQTEQKRKKEEQIKRRTKNKTNCMYIIEKGFDMEIGNTQKNTQTKLVQVQIWTNILSNISINQFQNDIYIYIQCIDTLSIFKQFKNLG